MFKKIQFKKNAVCAVASFSSLCLIFFIYFQYVHFYEKDKLKTIVESYIIDQNTPVGSYPKDFYYSKTPKLILSKGGLFQRKYSILTNDGIYKSPKVEIQDSDKFTVLQLQVKRGLFSNWELHQLTRYDAYDTNYKEIVTILEKNVDLANTNEIKTRKFIPFSPNEIQVEQEKQQQLESTLKQIEKEKKSFDALNKQEKLEFLQKSTRDASQDPGLDDMTKQIIIERNKIFIKKLESGEGVTSKDVWAGLG